MRLELNYITFVFTTLLFSLKAWCKEIDAGSCNELGFLPSLKCLSCKDLSQFNLSFLAVDCSKCCVEAEEDDSAAKVLYPYAHLVVCQWKLSRYPQVEAFIKSDRVSKHPGLEVRYARGADPTIKLLDKQHQVVEVLGVDKWNTDSIEEFLAERLL